MECKCLDDNLAEEWQRFVDSSPDATLAHDIAWRGIIHRALGHTPRYLMAFEGGTVRGVLPLFELKHAMMGHRLVSVPVLDQAGMLTESPTARDTLSKGLGDMLQKSKCKYAQLRCGPDPQPSPNPRKGVLLLNIPNEPSKLWDGFRPEIRNQIRKSEKCGVAVESGGSELIDGFYRVYSLNMRDLGVPVLPRRLFAETVVGLGDRAEVLLARAGRETIGGAILVRFRDTVSVPWASAAREHFGSCPNHAIYWRAMRDACERGYRVFDFGRSSWGSGPFLFKTQWGAVPVALKWEYWPQDAIKGEPNVSTSNPKYGLLVSAWKRLPVPVANVIGPLISGQVA